MLISKNIKINITNRNIKDYLTIPDVKIGEIEIDIKYLSKGSHTKVHAKCDICNKERNIPYRQYLLSNNNGDFYCCSPKCAQIKNLNTNIYNHGIENVFQLTETKEKIKKTCMKKYGVDSYLKTQEKQEKSKETCINKYGFESSNQSEVVKNNKKTSYMKLYGVENPSQIESVKEQKNKTYINSHIKKYGVLPDERNLKMRTYRNKVKNLTNKLKEDLLKNWDGYDFYDGEYIKNNFNLNYIHKDYPTIDHKISVFYGFNNNISPEEICKLENLCFTKRTINSKKQEDCDYERKEKN